MEASHPLANAPVRQGVLAALWVPCDEDGVLKRAGMARHMAFLKEAGIHGILALGSTGEFVRMSLAQREEVLAAVIELAAPLPVIANLSSIRLDEVVSLGHSAKKLGAVGASLMPPSFYPVSQADMLEFFLRAADRVDLPFYLYNFPELIGNRIGLETIASFADQAKMAGIKQSGGEFAYHESLIKLGREKNFAVFSGSDTRLPEAFALGVSGAIGGLVNFVPELMVHIYRACQDGHPESASEAQARMVEIGTVVNRLTFPLNVAAGLEARGFDPGAPKTVVSSQSRELYRTMAGEFKQLFAKWGLPSSR